MTKVGRNRLEAQRSDCTSAGAVRCTDDCTDRVIISDTRLVAMKEHLAVIPARAIVMRLNPRISRIVLVSTQIAMEKVLGPDI